jgi:acetyltransferase-like isoleucine patch superfamily enzyme
MKPGSIESMVHLWSRLRNRAFTLLLASQFREFGVGSRIVPPLTFWGLNQMSIADRVIIQRDCWIQVIGGYADEKSVKIIIKSHASIGKRTAITAAQQIVIGEHVMIGSNCLITDHSHAFDNVNIPIRKQGIDSIKPVSIGPETFVGNNVFVQPGVNIGRHCVIGTNSIVSASIPDFSVAVGMPARVVKTLKPNPNRAEQLEAQADIQGRAPDSFA